MSKMAVNLQPLSLSLLLADLADNDRDRERRRQCDRSERERECEREEQTKEKETHRQLGRPRKEYARIMINLVSAYGIFK